MSMIAPASVLRAEGRQARQSTMSRVATVAAVATPSAAVVAAAQTHPSCTANQQHRWRAYCSSASQPPSSSSEAPAAAADNQSSSTSGNATNTQPSSTISYTPSVMCGWVVNKQPINASMTPELYSYMLGLTKEHEVRWLLVGGGWRLPGGATIASCFECGLRGASAVHLCSCITNMPHAQQQPRAIAVFISLAAGVGCAKRGDCRHTWRPHAGVVKHE